MKFFVGVLLFIIAILTPSNAQNNNKIPLITRRVGSSCRNLSGDGGIRIISPHNDLIAEVTFGSVTRPFTPQKILDGRYEYIIPIDISDSPEVKIVVTRKGVSTASGTIVEKRLQVNHVVEYEVLSYDNPIFLNEIGEGLFPSEEEVLIEIKSIFDLNINTPNELLRIERVKDIDPDKKMYKIHVPLKYLNDIDSQHKTLSEMNDSIFRIENDEGIDPITAQRQIDRLLEESTRISETIRFMSRISITTEKSNPQYIDIDGMQSKRYRRYGVEPLGVVKTKASEEFEKNVNGKALAASFLVPGAGQFYKQNSVGAAFLVSELGLIGGGTVCHFLKQKQNKIIDDNFSSYDDVSSARKMSTKYKNTMWVCFGLAAALHIGNMIHAWFSPDKNKKRANLTVGLMPVVIPTNNYLQTSYAMGAGIQIKY